MLKTDQTLTLETLLHHSSLALGPGIDGALLAGVGPFTRAAEPPRSGTAFYCNDFALSNPTPWLIPSQVIRLEKPLPTDERTLQVGPWTEPSAEAFAEVFREVSQSIASGKIEKSVPACAATAEILEGDPRELLGACFDLPEPMMPYGMWDGDSGFVGASPELLFRLDHGDLETMALAGTARANEAEIFIFDDKEIREHEFVAQTLVSKLSDIGMVIRKNREVMNLGSLIHFLSKIRVELYRNERIEDMIRRLHPTPALGPLPRTRETLAQLHQWRARLDCPAQFGAPFGVLEDGIFTSLVAIRSVHWNKNELTVPSGCGLIEASRLVNEWRELRLKRESVRQLFGI